MIIGSFLGGWEIVLILAMILILSGARTLPEISHHAADRPKDPREAALFLLTAILAILALTLILQFFSQF